MKLSRKKVVRTQKKIIYTLEIGKRSFLGGENVI